MFVQPATPALAREPAGASATAVRGDTGRSDTSYQPTAGFAALLSGVVARSLLASHPAPAVTLPAPEPSRSVDAWPEADPSAREREDPPVDTASEDEAINARTADKEPALDPADDDRTLAMDGAIGTVPTLAPLPAVPTPLPTATKSVPATGSSAAEPVLPSMTGSPGTAEPAAAVQGRTVAAEGAAAEPVAQRGGHAALGADRPAGVEPAQAPQPAAGPAARAAAQAAAQPAADSVRTLRLADGTPVALTVVTATPDVASAAGGKPAAPALAQGNAAADSPGRGGEAVQAALMQPEKQATPAPAAGSAGADVMFTAPQTAFVTAAGSADADGGAGDAFAYRGGAAAGHSAPAARAGERAGLSLRATPDQVAVHVSRAARNGTDRIEISLDPESLGRVEVRLEVGRDGRVSALILADNREALDLLKAEARALQQTLQDAGLKADANSLSFDMRGEHGRRSAEPFFLPQERSGADARMTRTIAEGAAPTHAVDNTGKTTSSRRLDLLA